MSFFIGLIVGIAACVTAYLFRAKIMTALGIKFPPANPNA